MKLAEKSEKELIKLWYKGRDWLKDHMNYSELFLRGLKAMEAIEDELHLRGRKYRKANG